MVLTYASSGIPSEPQGIYHPSFDYIKQQVSVICSQMPSNLDDFISVHDIQLIANIIENERAYAGTNAIVGSLERIKRHIDIVLHSAEVVEAPSHLGSFIRARELYIIANMIDKEMMKIQTPSPDRKKTFASVVGSGQHVPGGNLFNPDASEFVPTICSIPGTQEDNASMVATVPGHERVNSLESSCLSGNAFRSVPPLCSISATHEGYAAVATIAGRGGMNSLEPFWLGANAFESAPPICGIPTMLEGNTSIVATVARDERINPLESSWPSANAVQSVPPIYDILAMHENKTSRVTQIAGDKGMYSLESTWLLANAIEFVPSVRTYSSDPSDQKKDETWHCEYGLCSLPSSSHEVCDSLVYPRDRLMHVIARVAQLGFQDYQECKEFINNHAAGLGEAVLRQINDCMEDDPVLLYSCPVDSYQRLKLVIIQLENSQPVFLGGLPHEACVTDTCRQVPRNRA